MATPEPAAGSPEWWLARLEPQLEERRNHMERMENYYEGRHPLPFLTKAHEAKMVDEFRRLLDESRSNFCRLVVDATEERLQVEGFRLSARSDQTADQDSWDIWQANQMDSESSTAILDALIKGHSYLSVWSGERPRRDPPVIAIEDPCETIVAYTPGSNYRSRDAALKLWKDRDTDTMRANIYLPDAIVKFQAPIKQENDPATAYAASIAGERKPDWERLADGDVVRNPWRVVPIIPLRNRPRIQREGESELRDVVHVQNQINAFLFLMALAGYFGAHRQRWVAGIPILKDKDGKTIEPWDAAIDRLWHSENPDTKFGEFDQTDLNGYIQAIEQKVLHIAVTTRTPRHYLIEQGQSPSGDAIVSAESGLVKKCERKQRPFGEGFEEAIRLARRFAGKPDSPPDSEIVWGDASTPTRAQLADATVKLTQAGLITRAQALADLGYTQTQINRMLAELAVEQILFPPVTPPTPAPEPAPAEA